MKRRIQNNPATTLARTLMLGLGILLSGNVLAAGRVTYATTGDLAAEATARENADTTLQGNIAEEATARGNTDTALQGSIAAVDSARQAGDTTLQTNINTEASARGAADTTQQANIAAETSARQAGDTTLQTNITAVSNARLAGDNTLQANINTEANARGTADTTLQASIATVSTARQAGDTTLQNNINAEANIRGAADTTLQGNIAAEAGTRQAAVQDLQGQINGLTNSAVLPLPVGYGGVLQVCGNTGILQWQPCYYAIGDTGPAGGKVFYITANGIHGLEAAPQDQGAAPWGCEGTAISGADGAGIGTGAQNTAEILAGCNELGIAAELADEYELNGYTDWFLPSRDELNQLYVNRAVVGGFSRDHYWSSREESVTYAASQRFDDDGDHNIPDKHYAFRVRAVRAF